MKFKINITKEVIDKSLMCGTEGHLSRVGANCAFAVAYNELVPNSWVSDSCVSFDKRDGSLGFYLISETDLTYDQIRFIRKFDSLEHNPTDRYSLVGQSFDVEIPDEVIEYWYGDASKAAQKIIDNPIMQVA